MDKASDTMKVADDVADTAKAVDNAGATVNAVGKTTEIQKATPFGELIQTQKLTRNKKQFYELLDDIEKNGILEPIKFVEYGGKKYVVDGHHRLRVAQKLNLEEVPIQRVSLPYKDYHNINDLFWVE